MGKKGSKLSPEAEKAAESLAGQLSTLGDINTRKMFGGVGLFSDDRMFAIVDSSGGAFFKVGPGNEAFASLPGATRHGRMPYYSVPAHVLQDDGALLEWAAKSIDEARNS